MTASVNVLITSISKKIPLIKAVRNAAYILNASYPKVIDKIIGADSDVDCIGRYFVDDFWHSPIQEILKLEDILSFCKKHHIKMIIPTRDGELEFYARHQEVLRREGISCLISSLQTIENCSNKLKFFEFLKKHQLPSITTSKDVHDLSSSSFVVKECFGAGSTSIGLNLNKNEAKAWSKKLKNPIFQPYIVGNEYSVDLYISKEKRLIGAIVRERSLIKNGESQITKSVKLQKLEEICIKAALALDIYGHAVFQAIKDRSNHLHIIECNARFGGASTLSNAMGLNSFLWFMQESVNIDLSPFKRSETELMQVRFPEDIILPND